MKTSKFVVFRHGSNAANQSMVLVAPVHYCEAISMEAAKDDARRAGVTLYFNQHLSAKYASRCGKKIVESAIGATERRAAFYANLEPKN